MPRDESGDISGNADRGLGLRGRGTGRKPRGKVPGRPCCRGPCQGRCLSTPLLMSPHFSRFGCTETTLSTRREKLHLTQRVISLFCLLPTHSLPFLLPSVSICISVFLLAPPIPLQIKRISVPRLQEDPQLCLVL